MILNLDGIWNYGFAYNISKGLIPYLDFNLIIPPLWPYILSIPIKLFGNWFGIYYFVVGIVISLITFICYKKIGLRALIIYFILIMYPNGGYNLFCLFLFLILINLVDSDNCDDVVVAVIVSLMVLTKQTLGILIIPSIIFSKNKKKMICVYFVSFFILLLYLIINNNMFYFFDYCFLGMLDFTKNGRDSNLVVIFMEVFVILFLVYRFFRSDFKDKVVLYLIFFQIIILPIIELPHFMITFVPVLYYMLINFKKMFRFIIIAWVCCFVLTLYCIDFSNYFKNKEMIYDNKNSFLYGNRVPLYLISDFDVIKKYMDSYEGYRFYFLSSCSYVYKLQFGMKINKYDLINSGNMGYNGGERYLEEIRSYCESNKCLFVLNGNETVNNVSQIDKKITDYVINNYLSLYSSGTLSFYVNYW